MKLDTIHHIAIIGRDRDAMLHFMWTSWALRLSVSMTVPNAEISLINLRQGQLTLELFIKPTAPERPKLPCPSMRDCVIWPFKWMM